MEITKHLKLPFQFDAKRLEEELALILEYAWQPHFNRGVYTGTWTSIALYSVEGSATNIFAVMENEEDLVLKETPVLKNCPYLKEVISQLACPLLSVRLLKLDSGAAIKPHKDLNLGYEHDNFRLHIPIITNDDVRFMLDGVLLKMLPGECWYTNVDYTHSVENNGTTDRVHLVVDGRRNAWSDQIFFSLAPEESFFPPPQEPQYSKETLGQIIAELKRIAPPCPEEVIADLEAKLNAMRTT